MSKTQLYFRSSRTTYNAPTKNSNHNMLLSHSTKGCSRNRTNSKFNLRNCFKQSDTNCLFQLNTINLSHGTSAQSKDKKFHSLHTVQSSRNVNRNCFNIKQSSSLSSKVQLYKRNNTEINNNTSSSLYMGNYNIKDCILRGNAELQNKKKFICTLKAKHKQKPLSVILINPNNKKHKSNSVETHTHSHTVTNKTKQNKLTYLHNIMLTHNNNMLTLGKPIPFIKRCQSFKIKNEFKGKQMQKEFTNCLSDDNILHYKKSNKTNSHSSMLSKVLYYISNRKENTLNKKEMFKLLKIDIYKSEQKVKEMLDNLKRIQQHNDEDLKRKGFVKNIGFLACHSKI